MRRDVWHPFSKTAHRQSRTAPYAFRNGVPRGVPVAIVFWPEGSTRGEPVGGHCHGQKATQEANGWKPIPCCCRYCTIEVGGWQSRLRAIGTRPAGSPELATAVSGSYFSSAQSAAEQTDYGMLREAALVQSRSVVHHPLAKICPP